MMQKRHIALPAVALLGLLTACGEADSAGQSTVSPSASPSTTGQATLNASHPGRLLASNCFQCHGPNGRSVADIDKLAGESVNEIVKELTEMRTKANEGGIMRPHAMAYTDAQIQLIADFFAQQR